MPTKAPATEPKTPADKSEYRNNPLGWVRKAYLCFVQGLFQERDRGFFHWEENPEETEILIASEAPVHTEIASMRPCISFTRSPIMFESVALDDMMSVDLQTGTKTKSVLLPGTMCINVCSRNDLESEELATFVAEHLWELRDDLQRIGFFEIGRDLRIGSPAPAAGLMVGDGSDEWYATQVMSPFRVPRMSRITPLNERILRNVSTRLHVRCPAQPSTVPTGDGGADMPYGVFEKHAASPFASSSTGPMKVPDPRDPTRMVTVVAHKPPQRPVGSSAGAPLPLPERRVEQSCPVPGVTTRVKV